MIRYDGGNRRKEIRGKNGVNVMGSYQFKSRVRYSETDSNGQLTLDGILNYFQDASTFHSEDLGLGISYLREHHMVWVLSYWQIVVKRYPDLGEEIVIGTIPYEIKGFMGYRNFYMKTAEGEELACANSIWSLLDTEKGMPCRAPESMIAKYGISERYPMEYAPRKIVFPDRMECGGTIEVKRHHLDTNMHVNNGQYVRMAMDTTLEERRVRQLRVEYKKSAVLGDVLYPYMAWEEEEGKYMVALCDAEKKPYALVELTYGINHEEQ